VHACQHQGAAHNSQHARQAHACRVATHRATWVARIKLLLFKQLALIVAKVRAALYALHCKCAPAAPVPTRSAPARIGRQVTSLAPCLEVRVSSALAAGRAEQCAASMPSSEAGRCGGHLERPGAARAAGDWHPLHVRPPVVKLDVEVVPQRCLRSCQRSQGDRDCGARSRCKRVGCQGGGVCSL